MDFWFRLPRIRVPRKGLSSRCWENLVLAMLGEQFMVGEEICGAVVSVRYLLVYKYYIGIYIHLYICMVFGCVESIVF